MAAFPRNSYSTPLTGSRSRARNRYPRGGHRNPSFIRPSSYSSRIRPSKAQVEAESGVMLNGGATVPAMSEDDFQGLRERLTKQGEDALGKLAQELLENPLITGALTKAFDARERAVQAQ